MSDLLKASTWSILTEIVAKVISPISFLVLTKILAPEDFGIVAVATTFISFVQIITDLGVSKVIIQNSVDEEDYKFRLNNTCFWFNFILGSLIFVFTIAFSTKIASFFGNASAGLIVKVMALQIIFFSLSSIQNANLKKKLNFKFLFFTRLVTIAMPLFVAIPLALLGGGYWALVIATVVGAFLNTVILWLYSSWKPKLLFDIDILKDVLNKSIWSSFDEIIVWIPIGLDTYLIGNYLNSRDLGVYTTSRTLFSAAIAITLGAILPVLYSHLARIQNNQKEFVSTVLFAQKIMYLLAGTMGLGVFLMSDFIERIFFNDSWKGISEILGIVFLVMSNGYFYSVLQEALRSKGFFRELFLVKFFSMFLIVPILFVAVNYDIYVYSLLRGLSLYTWIFGVFYFSRTKIGIGFYDLLRNSKGLLIIMFFTITLALIVDKLIQNSGVYFDVSVIKVLLFVLALIFIFFTEKSTFLKIKKIILKR
ncbi:oligosaccharide flippase family protein [Myroides odoratus]|uniref:oligosaccharide flippase family protein n=1 Tax=Myroides odoratus TaxID=256 RepID=UPI00333F60F7